eukprot:scaffold164_cov105-Isochrysis_galbana.AAC.10
MIYNLGQGVTQERCYRSLALAASKVWPSPYIHTTSSRAKYNHAQIESFQLFDCHLVARPADSVSCPPPPTTFFQRPAASSPGCRGDRGRGAVMSHQMT